MNFETLGDWCKWLERNFSPEVMIPGLPVIIRLDGNNFHSWTLGLKRPFDERLTDLMVDTTKSLVKETNAIIGYTQSDEITLILYNEDRKTGLYHEGKKQKILSKLTGCCVSYFNSQCTSYLPEHNKIANFDCRIYQVPSLQDACAQLLWRENDASKNSVSMLAQSLFSHRVLQNMNSNQMQDKMFTEKGVNWNDLPPKFKRGTYIRRELTRTPFSPAEIDTLPPKHQARTNPHIVLERSVIKIIEMPVFNSIANKIEVIFKGEEPKI